MTEAASESAADEPRCRACDAPVPAEARFCGSCGRALDGPGVAEPPESRVARGNPRTRGVAAAPTSARLRTERREADRLWQRFAPALYLWLCLLAIIGLIGLASHGMSVTSPWVDLGVTALYAAIIVGFCQLDWPGLSPLLRTLGLTDRNWWLPVTMLGVIPVFMEAYFWVVVWLGVATESYTETFLVHDWPLWTAFVLISVCPGVFEELAFRGFILGRLMQVMNARDALLVQAAMFSVLHLSPLVFVSHFVMGLLLGYVRLRTGSLWSSIALHMLWNGWVLFAEVVAAS